MAREHVDRLIGEVEEARNRFIHGLNALTNAQVSFKPAEDVWSVTQNVEHITLAEQVGINGIWKALEAHRLGKPLWEGTSSNLGKPIDEVIGATWKEKEQVPPIAAPKWGGPLSYWIAALRSNEMLLKALGRELADAPLESVVYPHPISGPLDARQRLEFLRFHLDRHRVQIANLRDHPEWPR